MVRTWTLTERVAADIRLSAADVAFLHSRHRDHVRLAPSGQAGHVQLTPTGHVGTIVAPDCRLVIRPKIPLSNLFHLLDPTSPVLVNDDETTPESDPILDFLAGRLARLLAERGAAGLHRSYAERAESGPFLHGRLDIAAQRNDATARKDRLHSRYEEFTADVPCNQVPCATAELVLASPLLRDGTRSVLRQSLAAFADVSAVPLDRDRFRAAEPDRLTEAYRPLLELCRLLFDGLASGERSGSVCGPTFLLDMERVFEQYVTAGVRGAFAAGETNVAVQPFFVANESVAGQPDWHVRPDVLIERGGRPVLVLDVKWKKGQLPVTDDLYQVLAYCTALGVERAMLVYPGRRDRVWRYRLVRVPVIVEVRTLRVVGARSACGRSLDRLGAGVREASRGSQ